jgi:hypothetical protein
MSGFWHASAHVELFRIRTGPAACTNVVRRT